MTVLSTLCRINTLSSLINKSFVFKLVRSDQNAFKQAVRNMSGGEKRIFHITPSRFQYTKFKDDLHFYVSLGVIPLALLILYCNIFIGPATLTEIPEGYEPKNYEYYKHPIKRWFAKHFEDDPQINYETTLHSLNEENEKMEWRKKIDKVKQLMVERDDYKGWYHIPSEQGRQYRYVRKMMDDLDEQRGFK